MALAVMGRPVADHDPVRMPVPGSVRPVMMHMAMTFPVPVSVAPSVTPGTMAVISERAVQSPAVMGMPPPVRTVDTVEDDPGGQSGESTGEEAFGEIVGMPPVVPVVGGCNRGRDQQARGGQERDQGSDDSGVRFMRILQNAGLGKPLSAMLPERLSNRSRPQYRNGPVRIHRVFQGHEGI